jgi:hypothetical protein
VAGLWPEVRRSRMADIMSSAAARHLSGPAQPLEKW